eukprot:212652_1
MSSPFVQSPQLPISVNYYIPKPSYDPTNRNCIIICTDYEDVQTTPGIYKYDIIKNESQIIHKYKDTFYPDCHGQFIDISNNTLIVYGGRNKTFKIFDLNTNQIKQINDKNIISKTKCGYFPQNTLIASINEIHIL